jgi:hypothetical protein
MEAAVQRSPVLGQYLVLVVLNMAGVEAQLPIVALVANPAPAHAQ